MKYILIYSLLFIVYNIKAQSDTLTPWEFQFNAGAAFPIDIKNENAANVNAGLNTDFTVNYRISEQYILSLKFNYTQHPFSDLYSLNAYPIIRSHYFLPMIGKVQTRDKFTFEEKIGFGSLYARIPAYLSQKIGDFYYGKSADESRSFIAEFDFITRYNFTEHFSLFLNTELKFSKINWEINYNGFIATDFGLDYISSDSYVQRVNYFPVALSLGVSYAL